MPTPSNPSDNPPPPWRWTRIPRIGAGHLVRQHSEHGCGPACGEMLLADRGILADQHRIAEGVALPVDGPALAVRLTELSGLSWLGGALDLLDEPTWELVADLSAARGSWAALLEPQGPHRVGHWVVVDAVTDIGVVLIRDPVGEAYGTPITEFLSLWRYTVLVVQGTSQ